MVSQGLIRNFDADDLLESFLLSAVTSVLAIRFYLEITGYPKIATEGFHIAHLLFGGLFMLFALVILFNFLSRAALQWAAIIGGIGFGTFIDELGKFITSDNNYFFQPTAAIIYVVFIVFYLLIKVLNRYKNYSPSEYLINALEIIKDSIINDLDREEKEEALLYLKKSNPKDPLVKSIIHAVNQMEEIDVPNTSIFNKVKVYLREVYRQTIVKSWFIKAVISIFIVQTVLSVLHSVSFFAPFFLGLNFRLSFTQMGEIAFSGISAFLVILGIARLFYSRYEAYQLFKYSLLISIFLTQFFVFYQEQFSAILGLFFNLLILAVLRYTIAREKSLQKMVAS